MSEPETKLDADPGLVELRREVQSLKTLFAASLILIFVFSFCVDVFLFRQTSLVNKQASEAEQMVAAYQSGGPASTEALEFWGRLNDYAKTHPDFTPILNKYSQFIKVHPPAATAAPLVPPAKKK